MTNFIKSKRTVLIITLLTVLLILSIMIGFQGFNNPAKKESQESLEPAEQLHVREKDSALPFNNISDKREWRIGFRAEPNIYLLELRPESKDICSEISILLDETFKLHGYPNKIPVVVTFPFSKATKLHGADIINPEKWVIIDMGGVAKEMSFNQLAVIYTEAHSGCWYMGSNFLKENNLVFRYIKDFDNDDLVFGIANGIKAKPIVRLPVIKYTKDSSFLPKEHQSLLDFHEIKKKLGNKYEDFKKYDKTTSGSSIRASVNKDAKEPDILWLLQWRTNSKDPSCPQENIWGIFKDTKHGLEPLYISETADESKEYDKFYGVEFVAALDLDGDALDEIIIHVNLYEGMYYKVFTFKNNTLTEAYNSFYFGL